MVVIAGFDPTYRSNAVGWWVVWLIAAAVLGVAELLTTTLALGLVAVGAVAAAVTSAVGGGAAVQLGVFVVVSLAGIVLIRPMAIRRLRSRPGLRTGTAALVGRTGLVLDDVTPHAGRIKIGGEEWSARPYDEASVIPAGSTVDVLQIKGATALVHPRE
jgi:membrane protein implicated in regulation of membrane protease activity